MGDFAKQWQYRAQVDVENFDLDTRDRIGDGKIDESKLWEATNWRSTFNS